MRLASKGVNMDALYNLFCMIKSLCSKGEPNILGWSVIVVGGVFVVFLVLKYCGVIRSSMD